MNYSSRFRDQPYHSYRHKEYPYIIIYTWRINSEKTDNMDIPCVDKEQAVREVIRCLDSSACEKVEVHLNSCYEMNKNEPKKWLDIKKTIPSERMEIIEAEVKAELFSMAAEEEAPDTVRNVGSQRLHGIPNTNLVCGEYSCFCCDECKDEHRKRIEFK